MGQLSGKTEWKTSRMMNLRPKWLLADVHMHWDWWEKRGGHTHLMLTIFLFKIWRPWGCRVLWMRCRGFVCGDGCWFAICKAHVYKQHRLQVAYIQEYFLVRANVVKAELCQLQQLFGSSDAAALPRGDGQLTPWQIFFSHIWRLAKLSKGVFAYSVA